MEFADETPRANRQRGLCRRLWQRAGIRTRQDQAVSVNAGAALSLRDYQRGTGNPRWERSVLPS